MFITLEEKPVALTVPVCKVCRKQQHRRVKFNYYGFCMYGTVLVMHLPHA